jgi:hypothetical protein
VGSLSPEQLYRIIEPLVDVGLELEQIRVLLFRLAFDAVVSDGATTVPCVTSVVRDQPAEVQTAWLHVVGRLIHPDTSGPSAL